MKLLVLTPDKTTLDIEITQVTVPTSAGLITILPEHENIVSALALGNVEYETKDKSQGFITVETGIVTTDGDTVKILSDHSLADTEEEAMILSMKDNAEKVMQNLPSSRSIEKLKSQIRVAELNLRSKRKRKI